MRRDRPHLQMKESKRKASYHTPCFRAICCGIFSRHEKLDPLSRGDAAKRNVFEATDCEATIYAEHMLYMCKHAKPNPLRTHHMKYNFANCVGRWLVYINYCNPLWAALYGALSLVIYTLTLLTFPLRVFGCTDN